MLGVRRHLDILGVLVLGISTGVGGGMIRDLLIGATPPVALQDETYLLVTLLGGVLAIAFPEPVKRYWSRVMLADAVGLAVFTVIGANKAAQHGLGPIGIVTMAALTATGGGVIRDLLVMRVPVIVRKDFYATAAILGGILWWILYEMEVAAIWQVSIPLLFTLASRVWAMAFRVRLPRLGLHPASKMVQQEEEDE
jgi:uncharacterized membrane protein YeiH